MTVALSTSPAPAEPATPGVAPRLEPVRLAGRDDSLAELLARCAAPMIEFVALTGAMGVGRSALLSAARDALRRRGVPTRLVRLADGPRSRTLNTAHRIVDAINSLAREKSPDKRAVILVDDLQAADPASVRMTTQLLRMAALRSITVVGGIRTPVPAPLTHVVETWRTGSAEGRMATVHMRPLRAAALEEMVATVLGVAPAPELSRRVADLTAGVPGAVHATLDAWLNDDSLQFADGTARLTEVPTRVVPTRGHPYGDPLRRLAPSVWEVLTAAAVLHPIGDRMQAVIAGTTGRSVDQVRSVLDDLAKAGILRRPGLGQHWRFHPPVLADAVRARSGPYWQARLAAAAVTALAGTATTAAEADLLAEYVVAEDGLVDGERAYRILVDHARNVIDIHPRCAARWSRVATRSVDGVTRVAALLVNARASLLVKDVRAAARSAHAALDHHQRLTPQEIEELTLIDLFSAEALGRPDRLAVAATRGSGAVRLQALALTGDWPQLMSLSSADETALGRLVRQTIAVLAGQESGTAWLLDDRGTGSLTPSELTLTAGRLPLLLMLGEHHRASEMVSVYNGHVPLADTLSALAGAGHSWDRLLDVVGADPTIRSEPTNIGEALLAHETATVLAGKGWPRLANELVSAPASVIATVITCPTRADIAELMGNQDRAMKFVVDGLAEADAAGVVAGTDELLLRLVRYSAQCGADEDAGTWLDRLETVALRMATTRARMNAAQGRFAIHRDPSAAAELVRLTREHDRPYDSMRAYTFLAEHGHVDSDLVVEAYRVAGELRALLWRARLRELMRRNAITVSGRQQAMRETEELLATMVVEALTNREMAAALHVTDKSVENRLRRIFQRGGHRSRVDLAVAQLMRSGDTSAVLRIGSAHRRSTGARQYGT